MPDERLEYPQPGEPAPGAPPALRRSPTVAPPKAGESTATPEDVTAPAPDVPDVSEPVGDLSARLLRSPRVAVGVALGAAAVGIEVADRLRLRA